MSSIADSPSSLVDIQDIVRDFYDQHPYPPPLASLEQYGRSWQDPRRRRAEHHLYWPDKAYREDHSILIAGCGTSQAAKHALRFPTAQVLGVDVSSTSVRFTEELKRKYNLSNLTVRRLAIEEVSQLGMSFDQIVCTGVLHHLASPDAGLSALRDVLKSDGAMHVMVYAPYGRTGVYMLQEFCRRLNIRATNQGIRNLVSALRLLPSGHPLSLLLREAPDFQHEAALADALLHPQDRSYSVPQLFGLIDAAQLTFGRWIRQAPYDAHCGLLARLPEALTMAQLSLVDQYAIAELFRGTMVRHSAILYRKDRPGGTNPVHFGGDEWQRYIPIRLPDALNIRDRVPAGASAVLINRNHTYRDIVLPIDDLEERLLGGVDGIRNIAQIAESTSAPNGKAPLRTAHALFEKLWRYDQVVFDTSGT